MKKLINHIQYRLPLYIASVLLPIIIWGSVFSALARPANNERLSLACFGTGCDITAMGDALAENISVFTDNDIKEVKINLAVTSANNGMFVQVLESKIYSSDILIFSGSIWSDEMLKNNIIPIPAEKLEYLSSLLPEKTEFYYVDGNAYGVILHRDGMNNNFSEFYSADDIVLAIFSDKSVNVSSLFGAGESVDDAAIDVMRYLLSEVENAQV